LLDDTTSHNQDSATTLEQEAAAPVEGSATDTHTRQPAETVAAHNDKPASGGTSGPTEDFASALETFTTEAE